MPPPDYGPSAVWPYAVAAAVVLATSLFYFFTRQVKIVPEPVLYPSRH